MNKARKTLLEKLFADHGQALVRFVTRIVRSTEDAEDIAQHAYLRLQKLTGLEQESIVNEYREVMDQIADLIDILAKPARITKIIGEDAKQALAAAEFPLMPAAQIAEAVVHAVLSDETGRCYVCQPGRDPLPYEFRDVPGPRTASSEGRVPPGIRDGSRLFGASESP